MTFELSAARIVRTRTDRDRRGFGQHGSHRRRLWRIRQRHRHLWSGMADGGADVLHTIGPRLDEPTIWLSTPSRYSQAWTTAVNSVSTAIMVSTCARSSASRVPRHIPRERDMVFAIGHRQFNSS